MSQLGRRLRESILSAPDAAAMVPGGVSPEIASAGSPMPFIVYTGANTERVTDVAGKVYGHTETVAVVVTARTRGECEAVADWVAGVVVDQAARPSQVSWWRVGGQADAAEVILDGEDESCRQVSLDVIGFIKVGK